MKPPNVIIAEIANSIRLIINNKSPLYFIKDFIPMAKNTICEIRNGIVSNSPNTPIKTKSIL